MKKACLALVEEQDPISIEIGDDMINQHGGCAVEALRKSPKIHAADIILADLKRLASEGGAAMQFSQRIKKLTSAYEESFA